MPKPLLGLFLVSTSEFHSKSVKRVNVAISASCVSPFVAKRIDSGATHITEKITSLPQQNAFFKYMASANQNCCGYDFTGYGDHSDCCDNNSLTN